MLWARKRPLIGTEQYKLKSGNFVFGSNYSCQYAFRERASSVFIESFVEHRWYMKISTV